MGSIETTEPVTALSAQNADPNSVVLQWSLTETGQNGNLIVPSDVLFSGTALQFTPEALDISQRSTGNTTGLSVRYERDIIPVPENGGFYLKTGADVSFSHHTGSFDAQVRPFIDETRSNILEIKLRGLEMI